MRTIPWEQRADGCEDVVWRYSKNPIIQRDEIKRSNSIFNSEVVPFREGYAGVFRCDDKRREMFLHAGFSKDGLQWEINPDLIQYQLKPKKVGCCFIMEC